MRLTNPLTAWLPIPALTAPAAAHMQEARARLIACLPPRLQRALAGHHRLLIVHADADRASLELITGLQGERIGEIDIAKGLSLPPVLTHKDKDHRYPTELRLRSSSVLRRTVSFPAQVRANLHQVIGYELDRLTPFEPSEVVFDFAVQSGSKNANRINLDLAICRRDLIDRWVGHMQDLGVSIDRVGWSGAWTGANLLPPEHRPKQRGLRVNVGTLLILAIAILAVAVLATPVWQKQQIADELGRELASLRKQAIAVDEVRQELESARQGSTLVLQKKLDQPPTLELLQELTERLPEDTWVQNIEINGEEVNIRGESGQATALIALLEQAPGIEGVSFRSPVTQIARTGKERFNLSLRYLRQREE